jgi:caspase domain-containing protein
MSEDWAIIVGVKHYIDPGLNTLEGPVNDAQSFCDWLTRPDGGNIAPVVNPTEDNPVRIKFVKSNSVPMSTSQARPTGDDIYGVGGDITDWLEHHNESGRRLYIYMAGHGCTPINAEQAESVALLMANARRAGAMLNFPATACAKFMRREGCFEEVVLIMDCCRSYETNAFSPPYYTKLANTARGGHLVEAYATNWDSQAHEFCYPPDKKNEAHSRVRC